jgi:uncharacterized membrane protein (DUF485 family)
MPDDRTVEGAPEARPEIPPPSGDARSRPAPGAGGTQSAHEIAESPAFKALITKRWAVSFSLLALLFVSYYGYIVLIATGREFVSQKVGEVTTLAIPLGVAVIVVAWALTAAYVVWANRAYDPEVDRIKRLLAKGPGDPPAKGAP